MKDNLNEMNDDSIFEPIYQNEKEQKNEQSEKEFLDLRSKLQKKKNKIRSALKEKGILTKGAHNDYDNYEYFSEAQYKELFTELFSKNGIELLVDEISYGSFKGTDKQPFGRVVTLSCSLIDIDTGFSETSNHTGEGVDRSDKAGYKATTGALKKFLSSTFLVATQDDPEREEKETRKNNQNRKPFKKGTITPNQVSIIKDTYKNDVAEFKKIIKQYNKNKLEELSVEEADKIINNMKGNK